MNDSNSNFRIPESELILNDNGSVYHLHLLPEQIADTIITVGDPDRVKKVSRYFDSIDFEISKREFITHTGMLKGKRISVISTGMGTDNIEILMTELDALVNIDLQERRVKEKHTPLNIIRLGTSGSLKKEIPLDSIIYSQHAIGLDNLMGFYRLHQDEKEKSITAQIQQELQLPFQPYMASHSKILRDRFAFDLKGGNTLTCPGFYAPQGRKIRLEPANKNLIEQICGFKHPEMMEGISNFEMETAGYYAFGKLLGHEMISLNAIVANRITQEFSKNAEETVDKMIRFLLERV